MGPSLRVGQVSRRKKKTQVALCGHEEYTYVIVVSVLEAEGKLGESFVTVENNGITHATWAAHGLGARRNYLSNSAPSSF
jgi:hypothetical protein